MKNRCPISNQCIHTYTAFNAYAQLNVILIILASVRINMQSITLSLLAAVAYSLSAVLARKRLQESNFVFGVLVVTATGNIILWPIALLFTNTRTINLEAVSFFAIAGLLGFGISRLLYFKGMDVLGASVNASIFAVLPMYSSLFAVVLLGESLTLENWIGTIFIVVGVISIERSLSKPKNGSKKILDKRLVFPLLGSLIAALAFIIRKHGLNTCDAPLLGVAIGYLSSFLLVLFLSKRCMRGSRLSCKDFQLFWKPGVCLSVEWILAFYALASENVSTVAPLIQTGPLFILCFTYLYLRRLEYISFKLVILTLLIVTGAVLVSIR